MALEAVVFPRQHLACSADKVAAAMSMHAPPLGRGVDIDEFEEKGGVVLQEKAASATMYYGAGATAWAAAVEEHWDEKRFCPPVPPPPPASSGRGKAVAARRRRRRPKVVKNREETESQRRNHIAVERNRRRQMNDYLAVLRSAMPPSYAHRVRTIMSDCRPVGTSIHCACNCKRSSIRTISQAISFSGHVTDVHERIGSQPLTTSLAILP
jgi:hypothetical protein